MELQKKVLTCVQFKMINFKVSSGALTDLVQIKKTFRSIKNTSNFLNCVNLFY